jgi:hypothetical protein
MKLVVKIVLLLLVLQSCQSMFFRYESKKNQTLKPNYNSSDTLKVSEFVLCYTLSQAYENTKLDFSGGVDMDSIYSKFRVSFKKLNLPIIFPNYRAEKNHCNEFCLEMKYLKINEYIIDFIKSIPNIEEHKYRLIPIIFVDDTYRKHVYMSGGVWGGGDYIKQMDIKIMISIMKGDEIMYLSSAIYLGETYHTADINDRRTKVEQKHWDKLVELVMRDYIKRLK